MSPNVASTGVFGSTSTGANSGFGASAFGSTTPQAVKLNPFGSTPTAGNQQSVGNNPTGFGSNSTNTSKPNPFASVASSTGFGSTSSTTNSASLDSASTFGSAVQKQNPFGSASTGIASEQKQTYFILKSYPYRL